MIFAWNLALSFVVAAPPAPPEDTVRYVVTFQDKVAGHQTVVRGSDGVTRVDFTYKDNGRGPELTEEFTLAPDGTFRTYHVQGTSTFGARVDESFEIAASRARWKSTSDSGSQAATGTALYAPLSGSFEAISVAVAALSARPDGKLPLIPSGTLTMRRLAESVVTRGGVKQPVKLVAITGLGIPPPSPGSPPPRARGCSPSSTPACSGSSGTGGRATAPRSRPGSSGRRTRPCAGWSSAWRTRSATRR